MKRNENKKLADFLDFIISWDEIVEAMRCAETDTARQNILDHVQKEKSDFTMIYWCLDLILVKTPQLGWQRKPIKTLDQVLNYLNSILPMRLRFRIHIQRDKQVNVAQKIHERAERILKKKPSHKYRIIYDYVLDVMDEAIKTNSPLSEVLKGHV